LPSSCSASSSSLWAPRGDTTTGSPGKNVSIWIGWEVLLAVVLVGRDVEHQPTRIQTFSSAVRFLAIENRDEMAL
jgi:hypothetical protein